MEPSRRTKFQERSISVRSCTSESDISEEIGSSEARHRNSLGETLDRIANKMMRMQVNLASERRENDFFIYDKKVSGGLKITEFSLIFCRRKLEREDVRVEANPLRLPNRLIYFEYDCRF